ncbi:hypothetical protein SMNI109538_03435 [Smaragdicoccus niigatensis]
MISRKSGFAGTAMFIALLLLVPQIVLLALFTGR